MRILVVEDDEDLGNALVRRFRRDGLAVDWARDGVEADEILAYQDYELVILDIGLPQMSGFEVLKRLRRHEKNVAVLMLTARSDIEDRVGALDVGADDYLSKPFDFRELEARSRALMRRSSGAASNVTIVGRVEFDRSAKRVRVDGVAVTLPKREYRLLEIFIGSMGRVLDKEQIAAQLFDFDDEAGPNAIETYIGRLRRKLSGGLHIRTIRGLGYVAEPDRTNG